jgi:hypothetical protein
MVRALVLCGALLAVVMIFGCGGGGVPGESGDETLTASDEQLGRGPADFVTFTAERSMWVTATMYGRGVDALPDPYIVVRQGTEATWDSYADYATDDDSGGDGGALCLFWVAGGQDYTVAFSTYNGAGGDYTWAIVKLDTTQAPVSASGAGAASGKPNGPTAPQPNALKK